MIINILPAQRVRYHTPECGYKGYPRECCFCGGYITMNIDRNLFLKLDNRENGNIAQQTHRRKWIYAY